MTTASLGIRLCRLVDEGAANLFPGYFAVTMATGATSLAASILGFSLLAWLLLIANGLAYVVLWALTLTRILRYPHRLVADMIDHARGPGFFTIIAGTSILGSQLFIIAEWHTGAWLLWILATALWFVIMYTFFIAVTVRDTKPELAGGINGAWLLAAVSTQSVAILTALLPWGGHQPLALFFALTMYLIGCMLYLAIITLIFYRLTFLRVTADSFTPPYWINMGAVAITTLAGSTLLLQAQPDTILADFVPFLRGFTLFFWATGTWWVPFLIGLMIWRHLVRGHGLGYEPQLWSMVFPLAMYTTGTLRLAAALDIDFLLWIPRVSFWVALLAWMLTSFGMWRHFGDKTLRALRPDPAGKS